MEYVNSWLTQAAIPYLLDVRKVGAAEGDDADSFAVELVDRRSGIRLSWKDVGFGFSQVLPLIMALATQPQNGTLLVEQPELHLHPRLQAELADLVVESVHLRTDADLDKPRQPTVIMETHSEHLLLRLMRRMRETAQGRVPEGKPSLTPAEVSIIYVHPMEDGSGSIPIVIDLDKEGNLLTAWPNGFFEEGFNERFA